MSNNTSNYQEYTFSKLLEQYDKILIPMIQRDYAQGRTDKKATDVRSNLLTDIFSDKNVHFDLVFGSKEKRIIDGKDKNCFIPVDGQQRLTTLFLLYLYGQKAGKTNTELDLSKFSYDTRRAASDFCKSITSEEWAVSNDKNVSDVIKDSSWFMNYWEKDPTVEGMLNMLDAIHEKCKKTIDYPNMDKVSFFFFDLESNGLNENLYLKMNSRGKPLTAFENLKAKIEKVLPEDVEIEDKCFPECDASPKGFKAKWKYFMDRNWTEAFWDKEHPENYDESITKFIVRFLAGYWAAYGTDEEQMAKDLKSLNSKDIYADFIPFEPVKKVLEKENAFSSLAYALTTVPKIDPYWTNETIKVSDKSEYKFLAVIFTYVLFDGDKNAMRFAWNMAENYVTGYDTFVTYCEQVKKVRDKFNSDENIAFYKTLSENDFSNPSEQLTEEIAKAQQILKGTTCEDGKSWKEVIIEAEKYAFFKGAIRCLFTKGKIGDDWEHFDTKWENAQKYFDKDGVKDGNENDKLYKSNALLMKSLLANCDDFWNKINWYFEFSNDANCWNRILTSDKWRNAVDAIMHTEVTSETTKQSIEGNLEPFIKNIVDDGLMDYVCNEMPGARIRRTYHGYQAIWQSRYPSYQVVLNPILAQLKIQSIIDYEEANKIGNSRYYKCVNKNVIFKYNNHFFRWNGNPKDKELDVYLMEDNRTVYKTEDDTYFCFSVDANTSPDDFSKMLDSLIAQADKDNKSL
jgi:hypothetical protein